MEILGFTDILNSMQQSSNYTQKKWNQFNAQMKQALKQFRLWCISRTFVTISYIIIFFKYYLSLRYDIFGLFPTSVCFYTGFKKKKKV